MKNNSNNGNNIIFEAIQRLSSSSDTQTYTFSWYFLACLRFNAWMYIWINSMALSLSANCQAWRVKWWNVFGETAMRVWIEFAADLVGFIKKSSILLRWDYIIACSFLCLFVCMLGIGEWSYEFVCDASTVLKSFSLKFHVQRAKKKPTQWKFFFT